MLGDTLTCLKHLSLSSNMTMGSGSPRTQTLKVLSWLQSATTVVSCEGERVDSRIGSDWWARRTLAEGNRKALLRKCDPAVSHLLTCRLPPQVHELGAESGRHNGLPEVTKVRVQWSAHRPSIILHIPPNYLSRSTHHTFAPHTLVSGVIIL